MSRFVFFQQIVSLVQNFYVGSPLGDLNPLSSPRIEKLMIFPASNNASAALPRCPRAADAAAELPTITALLPRCLCHSAMLPPCCHRCCHAATAAAATALPPPLLPPCHPASPLLITTAAVLLPPPLRCQRFRRAAHCHRTAAALPLPICQHCHCTPAANTALQMLSLVQHDLFPRLCRLVPSPFRL